MILGWWGEQLGCLQDGTVAECTFMDGPYVARIRRLGERVDVQMVDRGRGSVTRVEGALPELLRDVVDAADSVLEFCAHSGVSNPDVDVLRKVRLQLAAERPK